LISGRRCSRSHRRRPLRRRRRQLCRERGERKSYRSWCVVSVRRSGWHPRPRAGVSNPGRTRCFGGDIGQG
jgi:hypothetical protein